VELPHIVRCRTKKNGGWLNWDNLFVEWDDSASQSTFEADNSYRKRLLSKNAREILVAKYAAPIYQSTNPEIREIFADAQRRIPACSRRCSGYGSD
jgi:hypothetical protein